MASNVSEVKFEGNMLKWHMGLKLDSNGREFEIDVAIDCTGVSLETAMKVCGSGQSTRVRVQDRIRKEGRAAVERYAVTGYKKTWKEVYESARQPVSVEDKLMALSKSEFIELVTEQFGIDAQQAEKMYNFKHGIQ